MTELNQAFRTFAALSGSLQQSYADLESRVGLLNTELTRAQAAREKQDERFERLLASLAGGVLLLDAGDVVQACNPAAVELLGQPLQGETFDAVRRRAFAGASLFGGEIALPSGRHVTLSRRALSDDSHVVLVTDVTESHLVRELAARSQRLAAMGEMAARLAHQLRTPLAAALLYASQLGASVGADSRGRELARKTTERLHELERLIADMLAFAAGGGGRATETAVGELLEGVVQALEGRLRQGGRLTVRTRIPAVVVRGRRDALVGAVVNLVANALDIIGAGALVVVEADAAPGGFARIRVSDNGPGVAPDIRPR
ncbi:MAG TPA: histidine kinase dimerization/phospho-acceptor domain-containing protein, partial [Steroidobacteraceae bacterium]|nr:histidine kinase dimerization/phospho-acceptor domain-containing protein [Steroidobacteraceae bacterium]